MYIDNEGTLGTPQTHVMTALGVQEMSYAQLE